MYSPRMLTLIGSWNERIMNENKVVAQITTHQIRPKNIDDDSSASSILE